MNNIEKDMIDEMRVLLPKKFINAIANEVEQQFVVTHKETKDTYGCFTRYFEVEQVVDGIRTKTNCSLTWEDARKDSFTPEGLFLNLEGTCSNGVKSISSSDYLTFWDYKYKHSLSSLIELMEKFFVTEWCYNQIEKFNDCMRIQLEEQKEEAIA